VHDRHAIILGSVGDALIADVVVMSKSALYVGVVDRHIKIPVRSCLSMNNTQGVIDLVGHESQVSVAGFTQTSSTHHQESWIRHSEAVCVTTIEAITTRLPTVTHSVHLQVGNSIGWATHNLLKPYTRVGLNKVG